ncbi:hypothetical protein GXW74_20745 [Roseomonas eburnea]|uniref:Uncharacterized protein n=1 Tax=Neoroseomonas eburnea TaxID=1346889 RepID=A0A9X9XGU6_9PROT|nr:hypothetical protein [Neoroseomonas eburnea]MBR0682932.1 hypothetical protein [Neoroseomonas eburnea]
MFLVCQFGLADFRGMLDFPPAWRWPSWSSSGEGQFLRSIGPLRSRRSLEAAEARRRASYGGATAAGGAGASYFIPEAFFVDAHRRLGVPQQALDGAHVRSRFARLFRSGQCLRLQFGIDMWGMEEALADEARFRTMIDLLGQAAVRRRMVAQRHPHHPRKPWRFATTDLPLARIVAEFPQFYLASTVRAATQPKPAKLPPYIARLDPILLFLFDSPRLPAWCAGHRIVAPGPDSPFEIAALLHPLSRAGGRPAQVLLVSRPPGVDAALRRRVRGQLLHIPADLQSFWLLLERAQRQGGLQGADPGRIEELRAEARRRAESLGDRSRTFLQDAFPGAEAAVRTAAQHLTAERQAEIQQLLDGLSVTALFRANVPALEGMFGAARIDQVTIVTNPTGQVEVNNARTIEKVEKKFQATSEHGRAVAAETYTEEAPAKPPGSP